VDVIHTAEMPWGESLVRQRGGNIAHKLLFQGDEDSPDNYMLVLAREPNDYYSPRHCHPWDQLRYCFEGAIPIGSDLFIEGGEIGYFPESVPYGPQEGGENRVVLLLQFGGASGQGFIGPGRLNAAREELSRTGRFEKGYFVSRSGDDARREDAYEAIWRHVTGRPLAYAEPAYKAPIVMRAEALPWRPAAAPGVAVRSIGIFPQRGLAIRQWDIGPDGSLTVPSDDSIRFMFVLEGAGEVDGASLHRHSVGRLEAGETAELRTAQRLWIMEIAVALIASL
jgi:hypothetical protein